MRASHSIRWRLTFWYGAILFAGLCLFGSAIWAALSFSLHADLDSALVKQARGLERYLVLEAAENLSGLPEEMEEFSRSLPAGFLVQVQNDRGYAIVSSGIPQGSLAQSIAILSRGGSFGHVEWQNSPYRTFGETFEENHRSYHVFLATSAASMNDTLSRLAILILSAIPGLVLVSAAGGYWISRRALAPVDQMTVAARTIGFDNLSARLSVPQTGDELERLADTWNEMLARIEAAAARMTRFTADASHELRTPLALIRTTAELALRRPRSEAAYREALRAVCFETERMTRLVEDLLFLARADCDAASCPESTFDLRAPLGAAVAEVTPLAVAKSLTLKMRSPLPCALALGSEDAIRRLFLALLENSVKYTPEGGIITVTLESGGREALATIHDTGIGISAEAVPHIFDRFFRADPSRQNNGSCGLGLAIASAIAQQHHATIEVDSEAGSTRFYVRFPLADSPEDEHFGKQAAEASLLS